MAKFERIWLTTRVSFQGSLKKGSSGNSGSSTTEHVIVTGGGGGGHDSHGSSGWHRSMPPEYSKLQIVSPEPTLEHDAYQQHHHHAQEHDEHEHSEHHESSHSSKPVYYETESEHDDFKRRQSQTTGFL